MIASRIMQTRVKWSRRNIVAAGAAAAIAGAFPSVVAAAPGNPEKTALRLGLASFGSNFLPVYVAAARTWKEHGLDVQMIGFRGDAEISQALAGNSIDISLASMNGLINLITSGQPVIGFYAGFDQADFSWLAQPSIKTWAQLKNKKVGVATFGSLTDALTRYDLRKHGLEPVRDVQIVQGGARTERLPSARIRAGRCRDSLGAVQVARRRRRLYRAGNARTRHRAALAQEPLHGEDGFHQELSQRDRDVSARIR